MPLVTIGIPCYNSARWLAQAIDSALAQTHQECEVIVVDDGSTDTSLLLASAYGDRIRVISANHKGANFARNKILSAASGEWIQYLDADDYLLPEKIERQLAEAKEGEEADVIYSPVWIEQADVRSASELDSKRDIFEQWFSWQLPQTGGCLWRREALQELGGWRVDQPCCQEHELYARALKAGLRFVHAPTPGAVYRIWSEETLCRKDPRQVIHVKTKLIDDLRRWLEQKGRWTDGARRTAGRACFEMSRTLAKYSLAEAARYHRERRERKLVDLAGPAAPRSYRLAYHALGFVGAETVARLLRLRGRVPALP